MQSSWVRGSGLVGMREGRQGLKDGCSSVEGTGLATRGHEGMQGAPRGATTVPPERPSQIHTPRTAHFGSLFFRNSPNLSQFFDYGPCFLSPIYTQSLPQCFVEGCFKS